MPCKINKVLESSQKGWGVRLQRGPGCEQGPLQSTDWQLVPGCPRCVLVPFLVPAHVKCVGCDGAGDFWGSLVFGTCSIGTLNFCRHYTESMSIFWANCISLLDLQGIKCCNVMIFGMGSWKLIFSSTHSCSQASLSGTPWNSAVPGDEPRSPLVGCRDLSLGCDGQRGFIPRVPALLPWDCTEAAVRCCTRLLAWWVWGVRKQVGRDHHRFWVYPITGEGEAELAGEGAPQHHLKASQLSSVTIPIKQQSLLVSIFGLKSNSLGDVPIKWISWLNTSWLSGVYLTHSN